MANNFESLAGEFFKTSQGKKAAGKQNEIEKLAGTSDGKKVLNMLNSNANISDALKNGDTDAIKNAISGILNTKEGANLAKQLSDLMK